MTTIHYLPACEQLSFTDETSILRAIESNGKKALMCFLRVCLLVAGLIVMERG